MQYQFFKKLTIIVTVDFSLPTIEARREWNNIFKMGREKNFHLSII